MAVGHRNGPSWNRPASLIEPDRATAALYDELYGLFRSVYPATADQAHSLAAIQQRAVE